MCHNCGRSLLSPAISVSTPLGAFNSEDLKISPIEEDEEDGE